jgi:ABC-2 type transport system permease protein
MSTIQKPADPPRSRSAASDGPAQRPAARPKLGAMNARVTGAIFKRNFISYFSNPTGYVFICLFVLLTSAAAFFPPDFFSNNLANLDQLNLWMPWILLFFIPTITMGIWSDERRQGTDELLLTIPATDIDVVLGKYLAGVAIFTSSLVFSLICTMAVLMSLGSPDLGLFFANYLGYWLMGVAMLAIGMVGSFLTGSLTVAFVLGWLFNAPLVVMNHASNYIANSEVASRMRDWSMAGQFRDFARGVISLPSIVYFLCIVAVMLYACMVLIGRRHWVGGKKGNSMWLHYASRVVALAIAAASLTWMVSRAPAQVDVSVAKLSTLSPETKDLLSRLDESRPVKIMAYVSPTVPNEYVEQRLNLLSFLREFDRLGGDAVDVRIHEIEPATEAAKTAEELYDIKPQRVQSKERGQHRDQEIFLGVAFESGLEKIVVPFFERLLPVEYELARSVWTVNQPKRKRVGVLRTDAELFGGFDFSGGMPQQRSEQQLIVELKKQYEVVQVDAANPIMEKYDVLLAVQPSSLSQPQMTNFVEAVRKGQKTVVFEDPMPIYFRGVPGTNEPKRPRNMGMMGGFQQPPEPKGEIRALWELLGVGPITNSGTPGFGDPLIIWQEYNPHPKIAELSGLPEQFVFIDIAVPGTAEPFNESDPITSGLKELLFPFAGALEKIQGSPTKFASLVTTGRRTGTITASDLQGNPQDAMAMSRKMRLTQQPYDMAVRIQGKPKAQPKSETADKEGKDEEKESNEKTTEEPVDIDVVVIADIDVLHTMFFDLRAQELVDFPLIFDNVTFVLNTIDQMAGEDRFIEVRKRRPEHRPLTTVENRLAGAREDKEALEEEIRDQYNKEVTAAEAKRDQAIEEFNKKVKDLQSGNANLSDLRDAQTALIGQENIQRRRLQAKLVELDQNYKRQLEEQDRDLQLRMRRIQDGYKMAAVFLPPIPPLLVALAVFFNRRAKEREGVSRSRLR